MATWGQQAALTGELHCVMDLRGQPSSQAPGEGDGQSPLAPTGVSALGVGREGAPACLSLCWVAAILPFHCSGLLLSSAPSVAATPRSSEGCPAWLPKTSRAWAGPLAQRAAQQPQPLWGQRQLAFCDITAWLWLLCLTASRAGGAQTLPPLQTWALPMPALGSPPPRPLSPALPCTRWMVESRLWTLAKLIQTGS